MLLLATNTLPMTIIWMMFRMSSTRNQNMFKKTRKERKKKILFTKKSNDNYDLPPPSNKEIKKNNYVTCSTRPNTENYKYRLT